MSNDFNSNIKFKVMECITCHIIFAVTENFHNQQLKLLEKGGWYCPNGHKTHFIGRTEEDQLKDQVREANYWQNIYLQKAKKCANSNRALKGVITRMMKNQKKRNNNEN